MFNNVTTMNVCHTIDIYLSSLSIYDQFIYVHQYEIILFFKEYFFSFILNQKNKNK